ncbi:hypothetical protein TRICI_006661 [Trichomonascus ciferrii]|uniref:SH3 domain-containing protein n=1 Tax=Trichomonascus ciferrii TaxID=44093 RepID=A0A642UJ27_9ASCO|nr:hypothetical protein TRICI_006661 [Trichomonascus ciferrii]
MFRGTKKAIARAPHRVLGDKSDEDRVIVDWANDFECGERVLQGLAKEIESFVSGWHQMLATQQAAVTTLVSIYEAPVEGEHNRARLPQETPRSVMVALTQYMATLDTVRERTDPVVVGLRISSAAKCTKCKECFETVRKALTKRDHKKQDFDRHFNTVDKLVRKSYEQELTNREQQQLARAEEELDAALQLFHSHDEKIKTFIPHMLSTVSEFLDLLTATLALTQLKAVEILRDEMHRYCQQYGFSEHGDVIAQWRERYEPVNEKIEALETPKISPSTSDKTHLLSPSEITSSLEHVVHAITPSKDIKLSSSDKGMFRCLDDPLPSLEGQHFHPSRQNNSPASSSPASTVVNPRAEAETNRVRGLSSSSARALSVEYKIPESNEFATAIYSFPGYEPGDVAFQLGDRIKVLDHGDETDSCWWFGQTNDGRLGLFPYNYVKLDD